MLETLIASPAAAVRSVNVYTDASELERMLIMRRSGRLARARARPWNQLKRIFMVFMRVFKTWKLHYFILSPADRQFLSAVINTNHMLLGSVIVTPFSSKALQHRVHVNRVRYDWGDGRHGGNELLLMVVAVVWCCRWPSVMLMIFALIVIVSCIIRSTGGSVQADGGC